MNKTAQHNGRSVVFDEKYHTYTLDDGQKLVSGTAFLNRFKKPFDAQKMSYFTARKLGMDQEQVLAMWREKGQRAADFGTQVHNCAENYALKAFLGKNNITLPTPRNKAEETAFRRIKEAVFSFNSFLTIVGAEVIVFSPDLGIAGTIDLLAVCQKTKTIFIIDWKTNEKIEKENKYGDTCLEPLTHLSNSNFNHYSLQLNLYEYLFRNENYFPGFEYRNIIFHVNQNAGKLYEATRLQNEIDLICNL